MPAVKEKMDQFLAFSLRLTLSDRMTRTTTFRPAQPRPWMPRPRRSTGKALAGAPVQRALPTIMMKMAVWMAQCLPKMSAIWPQNGMKAADVRLKAEMIQLNCETSPGKERSSSVSQHWPPPP